MRHTQVKEKVICLLVKLDDNINVHVLNTKLCSQETVSLALHTDRKQGRELSKRKQIHLTTAH